MAFRKNCNIGIFILVAVIGTHAFGQTTANISVTNEVVKSGLDPAAYCSVNWDVDFDRHTYGKIFSDPHRYNKFVNFLRDDTSMKTFRYPGGTYVDFFFVGIPATQWLPVLKTMRSGIGNARPDDWTEVEDFFQFLQDGNFKTILQVNTQYWFDTQTNKIRNVAFKSNSSNPYRDIIDPYGLQKAADAVEQLACYVRDNGLENHVLRWEIGNEEYFFQTSGVYAQIVNAFIPRIKNILPNAKIIVTGATGVFADAYTNQWTTQLIGTLNTNGAINNTTGLVTHMYWASKGTIVPSTSYQEYAGYMSFLPDDKTQHLWYPLYDSNNKIVSIVGQMRDNLAVAGAAGKEIWFTEYRLGGLTERYSTAMAGAIGNTRLLAALMAAPGVNGACFYSLLHGGYVGAQDQSIGTIPASSLEGYKLMYFYADDNIVSHFVGTPGAQGFRMIEKLSRGNVLKTSSSKQDLFTVATSDAASRVRVLVVNKASRPEKDNDVTPNEWGFVTQTNALYNNWLAYGDTYNTQITLPTGFVAKSVRIHTLGESHLLDAYSVNIGSLTGIHEIKLNSSAKNINSNTYTYTFKPHSAVLFEFSTTPIGAIHGTVAPEGYLGTLKDVNLKVELLKNGVVARTERLFLDSDGWFVIENLDAGEVYDVAIKGGQWLRKVISGVTVVQAGTYLGTIPLSNGDVSGDNMVDVADLGILAAHYGEVGGMYPEYSQTLDYSRSWFPND